MAGPCPKKRWLYLEKNDMLGYFFLDCNEILFTRAITSLTARAGSLFKSTALNVRFLITFSKTKSFECFPLGYLGSRTLIQDRSYHITSKEPMNPLWPQIHHRFLWCSMIWVILDAWSWSRSHQRKANCMSFSFACCNRSHHQVGKTELGPLNTVEEAKRLSAHANPDVFLAFVVTSDGNTNCLIRILFLVLISKGGLFGRILTSARVQWSMFSPLHFACAREVCVVESEFVPC